MSGPRSKYLAGTRDTLRKVADEAQAQAMSAEDALAALEAREARRSGRTGALPPMVQARQEGRV